MTAVPLTEEERVALLAELEKQARELRSMAPVPPWARFLVDRATEATWKAPDAISPTTGRVYIRSAGLFDGGIVVSKDTVQRLMREPRVVDALRALVALHDAIERGTVEAP